MGLAAEIDLSRGHGHDLQRVCRPQSVQALALRRRQSAIQDNTAPVSYTHLDVYKRQEDGVANEINEQLYTTPEDALATVEALGLGENGRYMAALTFGNVHGVYKPGNVKLRPEILKQCQDAVVAAKGLAAGSKPLDLVFHGGSGSLPQEISDAVDFGVIKMNVDTDTQYAFTRPVASWMMKNYDGVLKVDGEVGNKKQYDPRAWGKEAEAAMAARVVRACQDLRSAGTHQA